MTNTATKQKPQRDSVEIRFTKLETALPFLATKADLTDVKTDLKEEIANVRIEVANVRTELKQDIANVRTDLKDAINNQTKWFCGTLVTIQYCYRY